MEHIEIVTVKDIRDKIPKDRLDYFLADLKEWVLQNDKEIVDGYKAVFEELGIAIMPDLDIGLEAQTPDTIKWIDDGQVGLSKISININGEEVSQVNFERKDVEIITPQSKQGQE